MTTTHKRLAIDATVVRYPLSGVHYAVRHQALAILRRFKGREPVLLATDPYLRKCWANENLYAPELNERLKKALWRITWQQSRLPKLLKKESVDTLLSLSYTGPLRGNTPFILQVHDTIALRKPALCTRRNAMHMRTLMPPSIKRAGAIITPSTQVADEVMRIGNRNADDIHVIPLGLESMFLNDDRFGDLPEELEKHKPYILFVGNIEPKKGIDTLVSAFRHVRNAKDYTLVLAGQEGWKCKWLIHEIDTFDGPGKIIRLGYVKREVLPALYRDAAVYIQPSVEEGFGLPVIEAMASGTPVVHSNHPVLCETSGGYGITFPMGDSDALAAVIDDVIEEAQAVDCEKAKEFARERTWGAWAERLNDLVGLYEE